MIPDWLITVFVAFIASSGAWATAWLTRRNHIETRIESISEENRLIREASHKRDQENRALWLYTKELIDHIYKGKPPPPPEPPKIIVDMD